MSQKILYILSGLTVTGGIERYNQNLVRTALNAGHSVDIVSRNDETRMFDNIRIYSYGHISNIVWRKIVFAVIALWRAVFFKPDLIVCGHINFSPLCYLMSILFKKKFIVLTHGIDVWNLKSNLKTKTFKRAHLITTVSSFTRNKIVKQVPEVKNRVCILPNSINSSVFIPGPKPEYLLKRHKINNQNKVILTVARLQKTEGPKGYYKVLDVLPEILKEHPEVRYVLVGSGDDLDNIRNYVKEKNIEDAVILAGHTPDHELPDYYNLSDVFIMPSKKEGFGIVFLEALACGKPVICGNQDGSVDAVLNGETGILVDPDSNEEIKQAIEGVLELSDDTRHSMGEHLRERVIAEFGSKRFNERMEKCLRAL